jgi:hypothetical protein
MVHYIDIISIGELKVFFYRWAYMQRCDGWVGDKWVRPYTGWTQGHADLVSALPHCHPKFGPEIRCCRPKNEHWSIWCAPLGGGIVTDQNGQPWSIWNISEISFQPICACADSNKQAPSKERHVSYTLQQHTDHTSHPTKRVGPNSRAINKNVYGLTKE